MKKYTFRDWILIVRNCHNMTELLKVYNLFRELFSRSYEEEFIFQVNKLFNRKIGYFLRKA